MSATSESLYKVLFLNQGEVFEVYARQVRQGGLQGFVEIEELVFGERSEVVVDPTEERLKKEFEDVRRFHVPFHAVIRIDEVERAGVSRVTKAKGEGSVMPFPTLAGRPRTEPGGEES